MTEHPLTGCWLKLDRANYHLKAFDDAIKRFEQPETHEILSQFDAETGEHVFLVDWIDPPETWSAEIGNLLHNLHSALDHLAWQLAVRKRYGVPPDTGSRATFPIFKQRARFWKPGGRPGTWSRTSGAASLLQFPGDARRLILDLQPYKHGHLAQRHPLWLLHVLSNEDKHKTLHVAGSALIDTAIKRIGPSQIRVEYFTPTHRRVGNLTEIARLKFRVPVSGNAEGTFHPQFLFNEVFADGTPLIARESIGDVINNIANAVFLGVFGERFVPYFNAEDWWTVKGSPSVGPS